MLSSYALSVSTGSKAILRTEDNRLAVNNLEFMKAADPIPAGSAINGAVNGVLKGRTDAISADLLAQGTDGRMGTCATRAVVSKGTGISVVTGCSLIAGGMGTDPFHADIFGAGVTVVSAVLIQVLCLASVDTVTPGMGTLVVVVAKVSFIRQPVTVIVFSVTCLCRGNLGVALGQFVFCTLPEPVAGAMGVDDVAGRIQILCNGVLAALTVSPFGDTSIQGSPV